MCLILPRFCEETLPKKFQFVIAMLGYALTCWLLGPSELLHFNENQTTSLYLVIAAFPCMGIFQYFIFIPVIPEMLERLQGDLNIVEGADEEVDNSINDKVNDAYGFVYAASSFVSPLVGSMLYEALGSELACDYWAFMNFGVAGILFIFNCGIFVFSEHKAFAKKLAELRASGEELEKEKEKVEDQPGR